MTVFSTVLRLAVILLLVSCAPTEANRYLVSDQESFNKLIPQLSAGDTVVLANGVWQDFEILFKGQGTEDKPIHLKAETSGQVILSGSSNLRLAGNYLVVSGLVFKNGHTPSGSVIEFRENKNLLANHSRVTEVVIDNFNNPDKTEPDYWVAMYGKHNRFDHNHLVGKRNKGVTLAVRLNTPDSQQNYHRIDHNYFGYRPIFGSNGGETLRVGTSHYSLTDSHTLIENNYFDQTDGEVEIVSIKSGKNIVRGNVFNEARGTLTIRHGNGNLLENNVFFGKRKKHTGGIRVINADQTIRNNYFEGLTGYRFGSGFTVMNGVPNSPINRYHQVKNASITNNSFINVEHIQLAAGSDAERSAVPVDSTMSNNLIINDNEVQPFSIFDDVSGIALKNNIANTQVHEDVAYGVEQQMINLTSLDSGIKVPSDNEVQAGVSRDLSVMNKEDTGVSWYPKTPAQVAFDSGKTSIVRAGGQSLMNAVSLASSGDVLLLEPGQYDVPKLITIDKTLTLKSKQQGEVTLTFERSALFEIHDGGSLKLDGLIISGKNSPDYSGNNVVRTKKWGMVENYRFIMTNSKVVDLVVNHSFHFFQTGKVAFADEITLTDNTFSNISGDILRLDTELEDLGIYNAEYVNVHGNSFTDIEGGIVKLYRGGSDESTFGPQLIMTKNEITNVGMGKRNKSNASFYLHGVQVTQMIGNTFSDSAGVIVEHTVGEPKTRISENNFYGTALPAVEELRVKGPHTAILENNLVK